MNVPPQLFLLFSRGRIGSGEQVSFNPVVAGNDRHYCYLAETNNQWSCSEPICGNELLITFILFYSVTIYYSEQ